MENKVATFSEPMYKEFESQIIVDGLNLAKKIKEEVTTNETMEVLYDYLTHEGIKNGRTMDGLIDAYNETAECPVDYGEHSGASWSAVRWATVNFLSGYDIQVVNGELFSMNS